MKKIVVAVALMMAAHTGFSQTEKGSFMIGGSLGFGSSKASYSGSSGSDYKQLSISLNPNASFFVIKRLALGLTPSYTHSTQTQASSNLDYSSHSFSVGPGVRYYFTLGRWAVFPHVNYNFGWQTIHESLFDIDIQSTINVEVKTNINSFKAGVGATYFLNSSVGIEGLLFYQKSNTNYQNFPVPNQNTSSISFNIGLQFYLPKKPKK